MEDRAGSGRKSHHQTINQPTANKRACTASVNGKHARETVTTGKHALVEEGRGDAGVHELQVLDRRMMHLPCRMVSC